MKDKIIYEAIKSLQDEGLKFSVDTLAEKLKISKKTVYKFFPTKEALALAIYEKYYSEARKKVDMILGKHESTLKIDLMWLYYESKKMIRSEIFNKYNLNDIIHAYTSTQNNALWETISSAFINDNDKNTETLRIIIDGTLEKLCDSEMNPENVIERLVQLI